MDPLNRRIAARLDELAQVLEEQGANPYRVRAYRRGAAVVRALPRPADAILGEGGLDALEAWPGIGVTLARAIRDLVAHGRLPMLERLRGEADPVHLLATIPGVGRRTAARLVDELGVETLEELEHAAYDGRLATVLGLGAKRLAGIRESLAERLARVRRPPAAAAPRPDPRRRGRPSPAWSPGGGRAPCWRRARCSGAARAGYAGWAARPRARG